MFLFCTRSAATRAKKKHLAEESSDEAPKNTYITEGKKTLLGGRYKVLSTDPHQKGQLFEILFEQKDAEWMEKISRL